MIALGKARLDGFARLTVIAAEQHVSGRDIGTARRAGDVRDGKALAASSARCGG